MSFAQVCTDTIDLTIMLDSTSQVGANNFQLLKDFASDFVSSATLRVSFGTVSRFCYKKVVAMVLNSFNLVSVFNKGFLLFE